MKTLITILTVLFLAGIGQAAEIPEGCTKSTFGEYSYQGLIDPQTITENWIIIEEQCRFIGPSTMELYYQNPDMPCEIPVAVFLVFEEIFLGFAYLHDGSAYLYLLDLDSRCYVGKRLEGDTKPYFKKKLGAALGQRSL